MHQLRLPNSIIKQPTPQSNVLTSQRRLAVFQSYHCLSSPFHLRLRPSQQPTNLLASISASACHHRPFTTSLIFYKRGGKQESKRNAETAASQTQNLDPFDFSDLKTGIDEALANLRSTLSKLRPGGRFDPEIINALRVHLEKGSKETVRLSDVAQTVPKGGRSIVVLVGEAEHIKPITSTILSSPHSLNPIPSPHSPLELNIAIPPPTAESRKRVVDTALKAGEATAHTIRQIRGAQQKRLRAMSVGRTAGPDDLFKAGKEMEKKVDGGYAEVKKVVEGAKRALEEV